jgi:leader peptidase (prepilin peptidase)/N-methyltransferase
VELRDGVGLGSLVLAGLGGAWGLAADRLAARWPAKPSGVRALDWRTIAVVLFGGAAVTVLGARFAAEPLAGLGLGIYVLALVVLLATDLDQRLLPDLVTLPLVAYVAVLDLGGWNPFVGRAEFLGAAAAAVLYPGLLYLLSIPFGAGALGLGDVKLLVSAGLLLGLGRGLVALLAGALLAGVVIAFLLVARRISLRSYVPFGPFLVFGIVWAIVGPA